MQAPELTDGQRMANLARGAEVRRERAELLARVKRSEVSPEVVMMRRDAAAANTRLLRFVESWPGVGATKAERIVEGLGIDPGRRLHGLGRRQRAAVLALARESWERTNRA